VSVLLSLTNAGLRYSEREVLRGVNLDVANGEALAIIGPNGSGKTTLLRMMSGALRVTSGEARFAGKVLDRISRETARFIAYVPQSMQVPFDFTVEQIVRQGRTPHLGITGAWSVRDTAALENALQLTDTAVLRSRVFHRLSGGEQQRVKIAIAVAQEPRLLLLDEPTQQLDIGRQHEIMGLIRKLNAQGMTIVAAIHELGLIEENFDSALLLSEDEPPLRGTPAEVLQPHLLESAFRCPPRHQPRLVAFEDRRAAQ
jgi:iron complex transport system ATP-binding protein